MCALYFTAERWINNYDLYELSIVPEKLPGGGGFSIKNITLYTLFVEQQWCRAIWTHSNKDLPLCRYTGCRLRFYRSEYVDYIISYSTQLPMYSNQDMYHTMHGGIHSLLKNKKIVPSKKTLPNKKPYVTIHIPPPAPLQNKWYFQQDMAKLPLVQLRTSTTSLSHYTVSPKGVSTNITINFLNYTLIRNTNFQKYDKENGYYARTHPTETQPNQKIYLYGASTKSPKKVSELIFLGQTTVYQPGQPYKSGSGMEYGPRQWGNPFHSNYMQGIYNVYQSNNTLTQFKAQQEQDISTNTYTIVDLVMQIRYNPYRDKGEDNYLFLKSTVKPDNEYWDPPDDETLYTAHLPAWILTYGYIDYQKKYAKLHNIDTDYLACLRTTHTSPQIHEAWPIISNSFIQGRSPYEPSVNPTDANRWYPCVQYQQEILNTIASSGPGSPKIPPLEAREITFEYCFYFKWGGNPAPMSTIEDPKTQTNYPMPNNFRSSTSLQNPESNPASILYAFDERRHQITKKALKRISQDWPTKEYFITDGDYSKTAPVPEIQETTSEETTSEEEEETQTLLNKLQQQRLKQRRLKYRIIKQMKILKDLE